MTMKWAGKKIYKECAIVLICLLMLGSSAHGAVVCLGSQGHISIEFETTDCCDESMSFPIQAAQSSCIDADYSESMDPCGNCVDIPLPGNCIAKRPASWVTKKTSPLKVLAKIITSVPTDNSASTNKEHVAELGNHVCDILTSIRTTVLII